VDNGDCTVFSNINSFEGYVFLEVDRNAEYGGGI
jgi:hypothetical protein